MSSYSTTLSPQEIFTNVHVYKVQNQSNAILYVLWSFVYFIYTRIYTYMQSLLHAFSIKVIIIFIVSPSKNVAAVTPNHTLPNLFHFKLCTSLHYFFLLFILSSQEFCVGLGWFNGRHASVSSSFFTTSLITGRMQQRVYIPNSCLLLWQHSLALAFPMPMLLHSFFFFLPFIQCECIYLCTNCAMLTAVNMNKCARSIFFTSFLPSTIPIPTTSSQECMF